MVVMASGNAAPDMRRRSEAVSARNGLVREK